MLKKNSFRGVVVLLIAMIAIPLAASAIPADGGDTGVWTQEKHETFCKRLFQAGRNARSRGNGQRLQEAKVTYQALRCEALLGVPASQI